MTKFLLCVVCILLAFNLAYDMDKGYNEYSIPSPTSTTIVAMNKSNWTPLTEVAIANGIRKLPLVASVSSPTPITPVPPGVRKQVVDALIEQVINDPVVHLKYWYWAGHSPDDLSKYIWIKYRETKWKVSIEEAQVLKSRAMEILDRIYKQKAEKRFNLNMNK